MSAATQAAPAHPPPNGLEQKPSSSAAVDALALRVAELLAPRLERRLVELLIEPQSKPTASGPVDATALAAELGVSRAFVYDHADELGAIRLGSGPKGRLRFDLETAREATGRYGSSQSQAENPNAGGRSSARRAPRRRRSPNGSPAPGSILAVRPRKVA
jgi:hypothetical protein